MLLDQNLLASRTSLKKTMGNTAWDKLPVHLQIRVLLWLPPLDLRRLSFTCKYFHLLLSDPSFAIQYGRHRLTDRTFLVAPIRLEQHMQTTVLNSVIWQQGTDVLFPWRSPLFDHLHRSRWWVSSYGDGFVCFQGFLTTLCSEKYKLLVFNPLFPHESKILTLPAQSGDGRQLYTAVVFDRKIGVCKLIIWCSLYNGILITVREGDRVTTSDSNLKEGDRVMTFVYNFKEATWKTIAECSNGSGKHFFVRQSAQLVNERFLCWLCTDLISSVNTVLVFDVEEEMWKDPIPLGNGSFIYPGQHEKQLCVLSKTHEEQNMKFGLWKIAMEQKVCGLIEFIPPPITDGTDYHVTGGPGFFWLEEWKGKINRWVYDISRHSWQNLGNFGMRQYAACFEASLFRLGVLDSSRDEINETRSDEGEETG